MMTSGGHLNQLELLPDVARQNIQAFYARHFPFLKERTVLHSWIESQWIHWQSLDPNNPEHNIYVNSLIPSLQQSAKEHEMKGLHGDQLKVRDAVLTLSQTFEQRPWDMIHALHQCLTYELEMISKHQAVSFPDLVPAIVLLPVVSCQWCPMVSCHCSVTSGILPVVSCHCS